VVGARHHDEVISGDHFDGKAGIAEFFFGAFDKAEFDVAADDGIDDLGLSFRRKPPTPRLDRPGGNRPVSAAGNDSLSFGWL
jgi:hypothetical protein